jgi:ribosomal-protein-alanine N-acetyltransferase
MTKTPKKKSTGKRKVFEPFEYSSCDIPRIRYMVSVDTSAVIRLDRLCFGVDSWLEDDFKNALRSQTVISLVATHNDHLLGYVIYELSKIRITLLRLCVLPDHQRKKVGTRLVERLKEKLNIQVRKQLVVDVPDSHLPLQIFLKKLGFRATGILKEGGKEMYQMVYNQ